MNAQAWTVLKLLDWTREYFTREGLDSPRLCAEILLASALGCERIELYARYDHIPAEEQLAAFREGIRRALTHEPIAYITGHKEFYSLDFEVGPDVLVPRPETEQLVSEAISHLKGLNRPGLMWDACTGCGCVPVAVGKHVADVQILATDISTEALVVARRNVERHGLGERIRCEQADALDRPAGVHGDRPFDVITANPPYVGERDLIGDSVKHEPAVAVFGGPKGFDVSRRLIAAAPGHLAPGGIFAMEFGYGQADDIRDLIVETGQFDEPAMRRDVDGIERTAIARRK
jgi:release factor glutamine methyltransferase